MPEAPAVCHTKVLPNPYACCIDSFDGMALLLRTAYKVFRKAGRGTVVIGTVHKYHNFHFSITSTFKPHFCLYMTYDYFSTPYCSSSTGSSHSLKPFSPGTSTARWENQLSGTAPCQCFTPTEMFILILAINILYIIIF